jgi:MYXO-CTERM domain-containing protein
MAEPPRTMRRLALSLLLLAAAPAVVAADAIAPPPECPPGAHGVSSHDGQWCTPTTCAADADCSRWGASEQDPLVCRPAGLCVATESRSPGGRMPADAPREPYQVQIARAACERDADCADGARCELASRCLTPTFPELVGTRSGCACGVAAGPTPGPLAGLGLVLFALAWRRRQLTPGPRRRSSSARA